MNQQISKILILTVIALFIQKALPSQNYTISGSIENLETQTGNNGSTLHIYLLTKGTFEKPFTGIRKIPIKVSEGMKKKDYKIPNVKEGIYGIRCFQDLNNNGELDRFLIIPKEPWSLSWQKNNKSVPPKFNDISFKVDKDVEIDLDLDK